jgi:hypothetical protein
MQGFEPLLRLHLTDALQGLTQLHVFDAQLLGMVHMLQRAAPTQLEMLAAWLDARRRRLYDLYEARLVVAFVLGQALVNHQLTRQGARDEGCLAIANDTLGV